VLDPGAPRRSQGFTLVEAMVTLSIVAIVMAVGAPSLFTFIQNQQIRSSAEELQAGLTLARNEALRRNAHVSLWLVDQNGAGCARSSNGGAWVVSQDNPAGSCDADPSDSAAPRLVQTRGQGESGRGVIVAAIDAGGAATSCITYNGFGIAEPACAGGGNPVAQIGLSQTGTGTRALRLNISAGGAVKTCDPAVTDITNPTACP
jgi:type IV fimbrial biogenesis protein FimT